jgi:4-amino-4-deoxy-L-arabinose transferase-like glycosyltransferase
LSVTLLFHPAVQDEITYLDAGHAQIAHWLRGAPVPDYAKAFSGAPAIYPPIAALADAVGGLTAARLLSLLFMLAATALLWSAARTLLGGLTAVIASVLFATTSATQYLGMLATYDAMSLMLLAAAAWCAIRAGQGCGHRQAMVAGVCVLLLAANATKYPTALWDPVVIATAALSGRSHRSKRDRLVTAAAAAGGTVSLLVVAALVGGPSYWHGIAFSTVNRTVNGGHSGPAILGSAAAWVGLLAILAVIGAVMLSRTANEGTAVKALGWVLTAAIGLAPLDQARIGVMVSLFKHVGFGAWFAAIPAGYGVAAALRGVRWRHPVWAGPVAALLVIVVVASVATGVLQAQEREDIPAPYSAITITRLAPILQRSRGLWLADTPSILMYYTHTAPLRWVNTYSISYFNPLMHKTQHGPAGYIEAIRHHVFSVVILRADMLGHRLDKIIFAALRRSDSYHVSTVIHHGSGGKAVLIWQ